MRPHKTICNHLTDVFHNLQAEAPKRSPDETSDTSSMREGILSERRKCRRWPDQGEMLGGCPVEWWAIKLAMVANLVSLAVNRPQRSAPASPGVRGRSLLAVWELLGRLSRQSLPCPLVSSICRPPGPLAEQADVPQGWVHQLSLTAQMSFIAAHALHEAEHETSHWSANPH